MKIGYFADGPWSHRALELILASKIVQVAFICVRSNSGDAVLPEMAKKIGVPCLKHQNINSDEFLTTVQAFNCDMLVSMSFDQIFRKKILNITPGGIINCHAGKLPFYRGRNILNWALINDEKEFGITVHYVDEGVDTGDIILQKCFSIDDSDNYATLLEKSFVECAQILHEGLEVIKSGKVKRVEQKTIHPVGSYCGQRKIGDERIDWSQSSRRIFNFVRAICRPGPEAVTALGGIDVKINRVRIVEHAPTYIGTVGQILAKTPDGWLVKTADSFVEVLEWTSDTKLKVGERFQ